MSRFVTFFMTVERTNKLFLMRIPESTLVSILKAISTKQLLFINTIPVSLINLAFLTFLIFRAPSAHFRCWLVCVQIPILDIVLPYVLTGRSEKILMIINWHFLLSCWKVNWIVLFSKIVQVFLCNWCGLINWNQILYCDLEK